MDVTAFSHRLYVTSNTAGGSSKIFYHPDVAVPGNTGDG
jgi:hypothetical protein